MRLVLLPLWLFLVAVAFVACSASPASETDVARSVESQVWSPYCPGVLLSDCGTAQARSLRGDIEDRAADGESENEILDWVREEYGTQAIARPETSGAGLIVWLVPLAIFAVGAAIAVRYIARVTQRST